MSFRTKLFLIVAMAALALVLVILVSAVSGVQEDRRLNDVEGRLLPRLELGPQLEADFEQLRRTMQDAVAAQDSQALAEAGLVLNRLVRRLDGAGAAVVSGDAASFRTAVEDYYRAAQEVSRRLIAHETGDALGGAVADMQVKHTGAADALKRVARFDRGQLTDTFAAARRARATASSLRLAISLACLGVVLVLSVRLGRSVLRELGGISVGLARFGKGEFADPIPVTTADELGRVAAQANQMALSLRELGEQRDRNDWLKGAQVGLAHELRGELSTDDVAASAVRFMAGYVGAPAGALFVADDGGTFGLRGRYALAPADGAPAAATSFAPGEGLVGQAALERDIKVIPDPPEDYFHVRSGLGEGRPTAIVLVPLEHAAQVRGVMELALFKPCTDAIRDVLVAVRETLAIALEVAVAREAMRGLLTETQRQAARLMAQEVELRSNNEELQTQQEELRQANDELEAQRRTLEARNAAVEQARRDLQDKTRELATASAYKSQFLANMSHELRTPLNSMLILSSLLAENQSGNLTDKQVESGKTIHAAGKDLLRLINQVLDLAKIEAGKQEVNAGPVVLDDIVTRARRLFEPLATDKGLRFSAEADPTLPRVISTDWQRVEQILANLVGNAIKFTVDGEVTLKVQPAKADAVFKRADLSAARALAFVVKDTGIGIAPDDQELVFAPFEQAGTALSRRPEGTGLGLSIARELASLLGGELHLDSAPGRGSTFTLYLPLIVPAGVPDNVVHGAAAVRGVPSLPDDRETLAAGDSHFLVIEDDMVLAEQLADIIRGRGFKVLLTSRGEEGLRLAAKHNPLGIILDVRLPDIDGWTVMERLRASAETQSIPVHFLSAVDAPERGRSMGAVGYLTKPATRRDLMSVVQTLAPRAAGGANEILVFDDDVARGPDLVHLLEADGLKVRLATDRAAVLDVLERDRFACLILDIDQPDPDGLSFLESIEKRAETLPIIVYTGRALTKDETRRIERYAETVVLKEGRSTERLLSEIRMFVQHLRENVSRGQTPGPARSIAGDVRLSGKTILVVDDDMRTVYAMSALLRAKGAEVLMADTGVAALEILGAQDGVDAVLMDVMMPEMDGYEAMRRIRRVPRWSQVPIIALTARAMKGERQACLDAGASEYLTKPIDSDALLALLRGYLGSPRA